MRPLNANGPISVVALPGQSSTNQFEDGMKNYASNTTNRDHWPEGPGVPVLFDREALQGASMEDLESLQKALHTLGDVACALTCQPRFFNCETREYTKTGSLLVNLLEALGIWETRVVNVAMAARPETPDEVKDRAYCILSYNAGYPDDLTEISLLAQQAELDHISAKRREASK